MSPQQFETSQLTYEAELLVLQDFCCISNPIVTVVELYLEFH